MAAFSRIPRQQAGVLHLCICGEVPVQLWLQPPLVSAEPEVTVHGMGSSALLGLRWGRPLSGRVGHLPGHMFSAIVYVWWLHIPAGERLRESSPRQIPRQEGWRHRLQGQVSPGMLPLPASSPESDILCKHFSPKSHMKQTEE